MALSLSVACRSRDGYYGDNGMTNDGKRANTCRDRPKRPGCGADARRSSP